MRQDSHVEKKSQENWDLFFLRICREYSTGSKDPSSKVASAIVSDNEIVSICYNGFQKDFKDSQTHYNDREYKYNNIIHAEINVLNRAKQYKDLSATLYVYPYLPCQNCAKSIVESGIINRVVATDYVPERWRHNCNLSKKYLGNSGIEVKEYEISRVL